MFIGIVSVQVNNNINFKTNDLKIFKSITSNVRDGCDYNILVVGYKTYKTLPENFDLTNRKLLVIDNKNFNPKTFIELKYHIENNYENYDKVFIIGGLKIYNMFLPYCEFIYVGLDVMADKNGEEQMILNIPDNFIPGPILLEFPECGYCMKKYIRISDHPEYKYLELMEKILKYGDIHKNERTGNGTRSLFGEQLKIDLSEGYYPVLSSRKMNVIPIIHEFNWYLSGSTNVEDLRTISGKKKTVWDGNSSKEFLKKQNLALDLNENDIGASYGFQFRHFGATYINCLTDYTNQGVDQISNLIKSLNENPEGRRHIVSLWNVKDLDKMALPPCLRDYQFYVRNGTDAFGKKRKFLDCKADQRSSDYFLAGYWNIFQVSYFVHFIITKLNYEIRPGTITMNYGDVHIYNNQIEVCKKQLDFKGPLPFHQTIYKNNRIIFELRGPYEPMSELTARMNI